MKYIDADRLKELLSNKYKEFTEKSKNFCFMQYQFMADGLTIAEQMVDSLQQEQPDFPTTDEQVKEILATHPKVEVPNKYKTPDWLWKKQEQPEVDLNENTMKKEFRMIDSACLLFNYDKLSREQLIARRFYQLGLKAK